MCARCLHCMFLDACHREGKLLAALLKLDFRSALAPCWSHEPRPRWLAGRPKSFTCDWIYHA